MKIGIITMGHSPRPDLTSQFMKGMRGHSIIEKGALDGLRRDEIVSGGPILVVTRLDDGEPIEVDKKFLDRRVQLAVLSLEKEKVSAIIILCSTPFDSIKSEIPLFLPSKVTVSFFSSILNMPKKMDLVCPVSNQEEILKEKWLKGGFSPNVFVSPPWNPRKLREIAPSLRNSPGEWVILDCMGFTSADAQILSGEVGKMVFLSAKVFFNFVLSFFT